MPFPRGNQQPPVPHDRTVLVIEDNELNLKLIKRILSRERLKVLEAPTARQGIKLALEKTPDLILMDIRLPDLDGLEATRILKQEPALQTTPILALSAYAMAEDIARAKQAGCSDYITKPFDIESFLQTIRRYLPG